MVEGRSRTVDAVWRQHPARQGERERERWPVSKHSNMRQSWVQLAPHIPLPKDFFILVNHSNTVPILLMSHIQ